MLDCYNYTVFSPDFNDYALVVEDSKLYYKILKTNPDDTDTLNELADELIDLIIQYKGAVFPPIGPSRFQYILYTRLASRNPDVTLKFKSKDKDKNPTFMRLGK